MPTQRTTGTRPTTVDHHWLPAGTGWHATHVWATDPELADSCLRHRTYPVAAWQCSGGARGPIDGVPVIARDGRLVALDFDAEQVVEHVEVTRIASRRPWSDPGIADLERRAYGVLERRREAATVRR